MSTIAEKSGFGFKFGVIPSIDKEEEVIKETIKNIQTITNFKSLDRYGMDIGEDENGNQYRVYKMDISGLEYAIFFFSDLSYCIDSN